MEEELYRALTDNGYEFTAKHKKQLFEGNHRQTNRKENDPWKEKICVYMVLCLKVFPILITEIAS